MCKQVLSDILTAYNQLMQTINNEIQYDKDIAKRGGLANNFIAKGFLWQMRDLTTRQVQISETKFASLADLGVSTNLDGTLALDQAQLASAIANKPGLLESVVASSRLIQSDDSTVKVKGALERLIEMADVIIAPASSFNSLANQASKVDMPKIEAEKTKLEDAMTALTAKYLQQFSAMQTAVQASQNVQSSLTQSMASWSSGLKG
jgi:flagellar hook-associated protein 2